MTQKPPSEQLPPSLFAFFIWDGNEVSLVQHVDQRPSTTKHPSASLFHEKIYLKHQGTAELLPVGVKQEAFHNQDVSLLLLLLPAVRLRDDLGIQGVINAMRLFELHRVPVPCVDGAHHGIHVQRSDDCRGRAGRQGRIDREQVSCAEDFNFVLIACRLHTLQLKQTPPLTHFHKNPGLPSYCLKPSSPTSIWSWGWNIHDKMYPGTFHTAIWKVLILMGYWIQHLHHLSGLQLRMDICVCVGGSPWRSHPDGPHSSWAGSWSACWSGWSSLRL